ncbi:hypothetical protein [Laribacter hongkongensis]|uniref:hypothetical protein n=1 Tax=Laribacter hongkongensis TaxID=168471 RepID=UPI001EFEB91C|nr:hypothetical protein [Laribacter hongkongensis]MCG9095970.1 hypothetical protein [Laribacter hongkongensis]
MTLSKVEPGRLSLSVMVMPGISHAPSNRHNVIVLRKTTVHPDKKPQSRSRSGFVVGETNILISYRWSFAG